ncbi:MAG TPA: FAD-linked oxidase C-terminal domain-containing protein, partial [Candidatus Limnocylindria bacterium]
RAMAELARVAAARGATSEDVADPAVALEPLREIVDLAVGGAVVRAALPLSAQTAFAEAAVGVDRDARLVADAASGIAHVHLRDDAGLIAAADGLVATARILGGSARIERSAVEGLTTFGGPEPAGAFLMRRLKEAFDPAGILEPGRSALG